MTRVWIIAAVMALVFGAGWFKGRAALQARLDAVQVQAQAAALEATKALAVAEQQRATLSQQLEDQANADPVSVPAALPVERVRRLNLR